MERFPLNRRRWVEPLFMFACRLAQRKALSRGCIGASNVGADSLGLYSDHPIKMRYFVLLLQLLRVMRFSSRADWQPNYRPASTCPNPYLCHNRNQRAVCCRLESPVRSGGQRSPLPASIANWAWQPDRRPPSKRAETSWRWDGGRQEHQTAERKRPRGLPSINYRRNRRSFLKSSG